MNLKVKEIFHADNTVTKSSLGQFLTSQNIHIPQIPLPDKIILAQNVSLSQVKHVINKLNKNSSSGVDGFSTSLLQFLFSIITNLFHSAVSREMEEDYNSSTISLHVKKRILIFILKHNGKNCI